MSDERIRVQNTLLGLVQAHSFSKVVYDKTTKLASLSGTAAAPSIVVNETSSRFSPDARYGLDEVLKRDGWAFQVMLSFSSEVSIASFERQVMENPPFIAKTEDGPSLRLYLSQSTAKHPVTQQSSTGTLATLVFNAIPSRM